MSGTGYASVVLDVDSTLCGVEGIDFLASRRGDEVGARIAALTAGAMAGELPLERVYGERLALVGPTAADVEALAETYRTTLAPGAASAVRRLRAAGRRLVLVSGGVRQAILPLARDLGIADADVHAVALSFDARGGYAGFDDSSPLTRADGKGRIVSALHLPRRILGCGDGVTDLAMRPAVDTVAAFTGFAARAAVVAGADVVVPSFDHLVELVLS